MNSMNEVLCGNERVLNTPLPVAYTIAISQMTWIYVAVLPFQLYENLGWLTIPGTIVGAYIILAMALIGNEIENPFGDDVNDLPLDDFCDQIGNELDVISAVPRRVPAKFMNTNENKVLHPLSPNGYKEWKHRNISEIREALHTKATLSVYPRKSEATEQRPEAV
jgi:ion channel-forming bestrophin family protein